MNKRAKMADGHKHHKTKFSDDTPEDAAEKRDISSRVGRGLLTEKEALFGAPTAPSGTYIGEAFDDKGDVIRFIGAKIPLYITPDILDYEFVEFLKDDKTGAMAEVLSRGKAPTNEDKIVIMAGTAAGRKKLAGYKEPSELFATDAGAKPMLVRDYYIEEKGMAGQTRGVRKTITEYKLGSRLSLANQTFADAIGKAIKG